MSEIKTNLPCILLLLVLLAGLSFMVLNDRYIHRSHRRIMLIIAALDFSLIVQNVLGCFLDLDGTQPFLRTINGIYGYSVRPLILVMFLYLTNKQRKYRAVWCLLAVNTLIYLTALFSHICFWIDEYNHYQRGPLGYSCHVVSGFFLAYVAYLTVKEYGSTQKWFVCIPIFNVLLIIGSVILDNKIVWHEFPVTYLTCAVVCGSDLLDSVM